MACNDVKRIELIERTVEAIGQAVLKQRVELDAIHSTIHELGDTVLKQREEHLRVQADKFENVELFRCANFENTELLRRAFGLPSAGSTQLAPITQASQPTQPMQLPCFKQKIAELKAERAQAEQLKTQLKTLKQQALKQRLAEIKKEGV